MNILVEGPDKVGKTTYAQILGMENYNRFPDGIYRELLLSEKLTGPASTFLFFAETMDFWSTPKYDIVLDRDILSMLVSQGILLENMPLMMILNLYKSLVYKNNMPDEIHYIVNDPFANYEENNIFEAFSYEKQRWAYEQAIRLVKYNFSIDIKKKDLRL